LFRAVTYAEPKLSFISFNYFNVDGTTAEPELMDGVTDTDGKG